MRKLALITALLATLWLLPHTAHAYGWTNDPYNGFVTVAGTPLNEQEPSVCSLAGGRTFIAWQKDEIGDANPEMYYQVLDGNGNALLPANGIKLVDGNWLNYGWWVLPDGQGGCISVFADNRDSSQDIWGQRVDSLGNRLWGPTGMPLVIMPGPYEAAPKDFNSDSLGNFFLSYCSYGMYVQKFNALGITLWGPVGTLVSEYYAYGQDWQQAVPDMAGGIIEVFQSQISQFGNAQIYVQHLNAAGHPLMAQNGVPLRLPNGQYMYGYLDEGVSDGAGGGVWSYGNPTRLSVWRMNGAGRIQWVWTSVFAGGEGVYNMILHPLDSTVWISSYLHLYRFDLNGNLLFGQMNPSLGGIIVPVSDGVINIKFSTNLPNGLYAQRINGIGDFLWNSAVALIPADGNNVILAPATDGADGAVVAFEDHQSGLYHYNILAQRIDNDGTLGTPTKYRPTPLPSIANLTPGQISYVIEQAGPVRIELFDLLGRKVALLEDGWREAGTYKLPWNDRGLVSGIYIIKIEASGVVQAKKVVVVR